MEIQEKVKNYRSEKRKKRSVDKYVDKIWITEKIKMKQVKNCGNKKISKKMCGKLYFSIFVANAWLYGLFCI